jgi:hypothetical protein
MVVPGDSHLLAQEIHRNITFWELGVRSHGDSYPRSRHRLYALSAVALAMAMGLRWMFFHVVTRRPVVLRICVAVLRDVRVLWPVLQPVAAAPKTASWWLASVRGSREVRREW